MFINPHHTQQYVFLNLTLPPHILFIFRAYYTIYDKSTPTPRVGFAQAVHPADGTVPNTPSGSVPSSPPTNSNGNTISSASSTPSSGKLSSSQIVVIIMVVTFTTCMAIIFIGVYQRLKSESRLHLLHPSAIFPFIYTSSSKKLTFSTTDTPTGKEGKFSLFKTASSTSTTATTTSKAVKFPSVPKITLNRSKSAESSKSLHNSTSQATLIDLPKLEEGFLSDFSDFLNESGVGDRSSANSAAGAATSSSATTRSTGFTRLFQRRNSRVQPASSKGFSFFSSKK